MHDGLLVLPGDLSVQNVSTNRGAFIQGISTNGLAGAVPQFGLNVAAIGDFSIDEEGLAGESQRSRNDCARLVPGVERDEPVARKNGQADAANFIPPILPEGRAAVVKP